MVTFMILREGLDNLSGLARLEVLFILTQFVDLVEDFVEVGLLLFVLDCVFTMVPLQHLLVLTPVVR